MSNVKTVLPVKIQVSSSRDDNESFIRLWKTIFKIHFENKSVKFRIILDFENCNSFGMNTTVILGAFTYYMESFGHSIEINSDTMNDSVFRKAKDIGFINSFSRHTTSIQTSESIIPYKRFINKQSEKDVLEYLENDWLSKNRLNFSNELKDAVLSSLWEIFANAFEHGRSAHGVFCCGSYDKKKRYLQLIVGDIGTGLTNAVSTFLTKPLSSQDAISWALIRGNSTHTAELETSSFAKPRGLGLDILRQLVDVTDGSMEIYTGNVVYRRDNKNDNFFENGNLLLKGTWVKISLNCKEGVAYKFEHEGPTYF